jgi:anaphase-promoting complex subunit 10
VRVRLDHRVWKSDIQRGAGLVDAESKECVGGSPYLRAYFLQIAVLANHQNGRDTHVRQIKVFGPRRDQSRALGQSLQLDFRSPAFTQYASVR